MVDAGWHCLGIVLGRNGPNHARDDHGDIVGAMFRTVLRETLCTDGETEYKMRSLHLLLREGAMQDSELARYSGCRQIDSVKMTAAPALKAGRFQPRRPVVVFVREGFPAGKRRPCRYEPAPLRR
jgi:hypothetical protein